MYIREATLDDAPSIARVHVDTWRTAYRGLVPDAHLDGLSYERSENAWRRWLAKSDPQTSVYVAEAEEGRIVGFASGGEEREGDPVYRSEVYSIYIVADQQRQGTGRRLMTTAAGWLRAHGFQTMLVWVLRDNISSRAFYEALGGRYLREKSITIGGAELIDVAYGWDDIGVLVSA
jgi:L-amino acid N-acyltransferase YncA